MTTSEVARALRVHRNTIDRERYSGRLACVRIGKRVLFTPMAVQKYIEQQEERKSE